VSSANVACGFHAGDPGTMRRTVRLARERGVAIGAHIALPDLVGFGRREMAVGPADVQDLATYQIGALAAIAAAEGTRLSHVKPHGALYAMCSRDPDYAGAVAAAIAGVDRTLLLLLLGDAVAPAVEEHGVTLVREAFVDLEYRADGSLVIEPEKRAWDPDRVAERALRLVREHRIDTADGDDLVVDAATICLHGDSPNAAAVARMVRARLESAGVTVAPLRAGAP
jgi:5-oxoprolinase (ATP-hydrolysing) subunit A